MKVHGYALDHELDGVELKGSSKSLLRILRAVYNELDDRGWDTRQAREGMADMVMYGMPKRSDDQCRQATTSRSPV